MRVTQKVSENDAGHNPDVGAGLARIPCTGGLGGTGKLVIMPVDRGFAHRPGRSFVPSPAAYDPHRHRQWAIEARLNAYAAVPGVLEQRSDAFVGEIPTILERDSSSSRGKA